MSDHADGHDDVAELEPPPIDNGTGDVVDVGELAELNAELDRITEDNEEYMRENELGMHPAAILQTQIRVLVNMLCPEEGEQVAFDIMVQRTMRQDMENAVAEAERQRINAKLAAGISTADIAKINAGKLPGGAIDLAALKDQPRAVRRAAARASAKQALRGDLDASR